MWRWLLIGPLLVVLILFALSNTASVPVGLWPLDLVWQAPLSVVVLAFGALAFLLGAGFVWFSALAARHQARRLRSALQRTEAELDTLRAEQARSVGPQAAVTTGRALAVR